MSTDTGTVMLVGSVARPDDGWGAEEVLHNGGEALGDRISTLHDGLDSALRRVDLARRHLADFGVATQCGWGRRPANERIDDLLALHRDVADAAARVS